jgi:intermediate peptidase
VLDNVEIANSLSEHERKVALLLLHDFEKSGVHMPLADRQRFIALNDEIQALGQTFSMQSYPNEEIIRFNDIKQLRGSPPRLIEAIKRESEKKNGVINIPTQSELATVLLRTCHSEESRRKLYFGLNSASEQQLNVLHGMLKKRADLAHLLGHKSYAHMFLQDKMAQTPGIN